MIRCASLSHLFGLRELLKQNYVQCLGDDSKIPPVIVAIVAPVYQELERWRVDRLCPQCMVECSRWGLLQSRDNIQTILNGQFGANGLADKIMLEMNTLKLRLDII